MYSTLKPAIIYSQLCTAKLGYLKLQWLPNPFEVKKHIAYKEAEFCFDWDSRLLSQTDLLPLAMWISLCKVLKCPCVSSSTHFQ